jgi:hypothetical protein
MNEPKTAPEQRAVTAPRSNLPNDQRPSISDVVITHEDIDRAHDREQVSATRARRGFRPRLRLFWLLIGPGILVMLGENDGPSMVSYAATGARFGVGFFVPFIVLTFPWLAWCRK